jgi:hypothetical protein
MIREKECGESRVVVFCGKVSITLYTCLILQHMDKIGLLTSVTFSGQETSGDDKLKTSGSPSPP